MCRKTSTSIAAVGDGVAVAGGPQLSGRADVDFLSRTQWWNWYEPNTTKAEKRLIFKLDVFILSYTCLSFFVKYLDQTSITNAFVTGMQQALKIDNNELNWLTTYYNIGIIVGAPFFTFGLTVVPPRYWLPGSTLIMALFVLSMFRAENIQALYGLRFCAGLFASGIQPGSYYIIGSWYRKSEISRRSGIFTISSIAGGMLSGPIQSGLVNNIRDRGAIAAWQWLFILDAIISIPVAIFGIIGCPDEPRSEKIWWMTETEREIAIHRLKTEGRDSESTLELSVLKRIFTSWQYYIFPLAYCFKEFTCGTEMIRWMTVFLHNRGYSVSDYNTYPVTVGCAEILLIFVAAVLVDKLGNPQIIIFLFGTIQIYGYAVFAAFPIVYFRYGYFGLGES